jgi:hypothetical protein
MIIQPLYERLEEIAHAVTTGQDLAPLRAEVDRAADLVTVYDRTWPVYLRLSHLASAAQGMRERAKRPPVAMRLAVVPPEPVAVARTTAPAHHQVKPLPLEKLHCWAEWPRKHRPGCAPARAVGNFSTPADAKRTIDALRHNLNQAAKSGNKRLIQVMRDALDRALAIT